MSTDVKTLVDRMSPGSEERNLIDKLVQDFTNMEQGRAKWEEERKELLLYIDATDTNTTTNSKLPFKNSTTINKIAQLHQNISTTYIEHLMPNSDWVNFVGKNRDDMDAKKRKAITSYVKGKVEASNLEGVLEQLSSDYADGGICACHTRHVKQKTIDVGGQVINNYTGTIGERINPQDLFYDVTASTLATARKCIRTMYTMGGLKKHISESTNPLMTPEQFDQLREDRKSVRESIGDGYTGRRKFNSLAKQGFGDQLNYINEGIVEVLTFYGDFYDEEKDELWMNYEISIVDRKIIGRKESLDTWDNSQNLHVSVWEFRKDSLAPIGPLNRVVGLQYKLDKRENFKEDLFDRFLSPPLRKVGDVREKGTRGAPDHEFQAEEGGDVSYLTPPPEVLSGDNQLATILQLMEDLSGSPREAIGQRTPGEKTKFEVQLLDQGQNKLFRRKVKKFERELLSPVLQDYLEQGRHHLDATDMVKTYNQELGSTDFIEVTKDDLNGNGTMVAQGATLFAEKANALQNLNAIMTTPIGQLLNPSLSRKSLMRTVETLADLDKFDLFTFGIGMQEDAELQRLASKVTDATGAANITEETTGGPTESA